MDHDQRFKHLLREFFREFMDLFFPAQAERLDFAAVEWLDKELFTDPPQGEKKVLDLVAKVPAKPPGDAGEQIILIHVEVESEDCTTSLDERFPDYFWHLRRKYGTAVLPVAVFLKVGLDGLGERVCEITALGEWVMKLRYWYVGLPALDADVYLNGTNWLGVSLSALMKTPAGERLKVTARALRRLVECSETPARKYLLVECLQAYAPLSADDRVELTSLLQTQPYQGVRTMIKTISQEAAEQTQRRNIERILLRKFKVLSDPARQRLADYPWEKLDELFDAALDATSLKETGLED